VVAAVQGRAAALRAAGQTVTVVVASDGEASDGDVGKALAPLAMDTFPITGILQTTSLNSIVTDSAPGASCYSTGNKNNNNQEGVFPDDTNDAFDNPRMEYLGEYLARTQGKSLGIVTTADVFDATPAAWAVHTANRGAGTGICDQFLDEATLKSNLTVLLGGGRKWFLPSTTTGSARANASDYVLSTELAAGWGVAAGNATDSTRDLLANFQTAGFAYAPTKTSLADIPNSTQKLLGLFSFSNMNVAKDKIDKRRGASSVVDDYGFPDQPMLDEMTAKALQVLSKNKNGFTLMVEAASIDKQAHAMDTERWMLDTIEFDRAVKLARDFADKRGDTLVIVTADHECAGAALIGGSRLTDLKLQEQLAKGGKENVRDPVVGVYESAGFPRYRIAADGYPETTNTDYRLLVGYGANADRHEAWRTQPKPLQDGQQPFVKKEPLSTYPATPFARNLAANFLVTGQVPGDSAVHTATDIPLSAFGPGAWSFGGVMDNTDVFFRLAQAATQGAAR
jgi:alkaline phosphatase